MSKSELKKILDGKKSAKEALYKICWPSENTKKPLVILMEPDSGEEPLFRLLEGCLVLNANFIVVSKKEPADFIRHPAGKITWVNTEDGRNKPKIAEYLEAADMAVVFEDHLDDLTQIMEKGTVVIGHGKSPLLQNYHPNDETGNAFTYATLNPWDVFTALVRAMETFRFPYDWQNIIRGIIKTNRGQ
jgi:hypothetical protein